ncbi:MAG: hypothetical protein F9K29_15565 [Hyphomicrobiaceae bacterium]|nr:MAG: hypothetical protein F9K29_15565 [Hyphomicrobiaceae bacterium]
MPRSLHFALAAALAVIAGAAPATAADRARAAVACKAVDESLTYECTIKLTNRRTGAPLENAELVIGADMPSMPMAHNVKPVTATATTNPGEYLARLSLEMTGDWALRLSVSGPLKDQMVEVLNFTEKGSGPRARRARPH